MENNEDSHSYSHRPIGGGNHQLVIITQLLQIAANIRHIDEMLLWLSHSIEQRLDLEAIQFWANQDYSNRPCSIKLRAMACRNSLVPLHVLNNAQIAEVMENLLYERRGGIRPQPVGNVFPVSQADVLTYYSLYYWTGTLLSRNILLPPTSDDLSSGAVATPLTMVISLFTHQPPLMNLSANVSRIVEYALSIAKNRGLLTNTEEKSFSASGNVTSHRAQPKQLTLDDLIPHRTQDVSLMQANNPFANAVVISDKQARRVYFTIDGKRSIAEISQMVPIEQEKFTAALSFLLKQKLICFYEPEGQPVDSSLFMKPL